MARVRISTTVDGGRRAACRRLVAASDSQILDDALAALLENLERAAELKALDEYPYEDDPDVAWDVSPVALPYDGDVPDEVIALAAKRRREQA